MKYKPDEAIWMAYLYNELEPEEKEKVERYLAENPEARKELAAFEGVRTLLSRLDDKEVIAPPIFVDQNRGKFNWTSGYMRTILAIAASLLLIMLVGKVTDTRISVGNNEFRITFGAPEQNKTNPTQPVKQIDKSLTALEVQDMINQSLQQSNQQMQANWENMQEKLDVSIRHNLASNSSKVDKLLQNTSSASQDEIRSYVATLQAENMEMVKNYFQLTSQEQKIYIEDLLVDFAKYLQQQRNNDIQVLQTRISNLEQNNDMFKQETEQILSSIISNTSMGVVKN